MTHQAVTHITTQIALENVSLTLREREVLEWLEEGLSSQAIADKIVISKRTVEFHLGNAYAKLGVHRRVKAISLYQQWKTLQGKTGKDHA